MAENKKDEAGSAFIGILIGLIVIALAAATKDEGDRLVSMFCGHTRELVALGVMIARIMGGVVGIVLTLGSTVWWIRCLFANAVRRVVEQMED